MNKFLRGHPTAGFITNTQITYPLALKLFKEKGWRSKRIRRYLREKKGIIVDPKTIRNWTNRGMSPFGKVKTFNANGNATARAYVLGASCGDCEVAKTHIRLKVNDVDFAEAFRQALKNGFGMDSYVNPYHDGRNQRYIVNCGSVLLSHYLRQRSPFGIYDWRVPNEIWNGANEAKRAFLKGWFDSEGSFIKTSDNVTGNSNNLIGIMEIKCLLKELGIATTPNEPKPKLDKFHKRPNYRISICNRANIERFAQQIGFSIERKQSRLLRYVARGFQEHRSWVGEGVLGELNKQSKPMNVPELARVLGFQHASIRAALRSLVRKGRVRRLNIKTYSRSKYQITEKGVTRILEERLAKKYATDPTTENQPSEAPPSVPVPA